MHPSPELASYAERVLDDLCARFPLGYRPLLTWRAFRTTAGIADYSKRAIGLGAAVLKDEDSLRETLVHEYAHLLAERRSGRAGRGHGRAWIQAMRDLGAHPEVRHKLDCQRNQSRQVVSYLCERCGVVFDRKRRLPTGRRYVHRDCGGRLRLHAVSRDRTEAV